MNASTEISGNTNLFLDTVIAHQELKNDAALSRFLEVAPPVISKLRHGKLDIGASLILKAHEKTGIAVASIKELAGLK